MTMAPPSFDESFAELSAVAYRVAFRLLGNRAEAEEVAQEALARAFARWRTVAGHAEPWVARVAINLAISRTRRRRPTVAFDETVDAVRRGDDALAVERLALAAALRDLPARQRQVVALRYLADLPEADVASVLHISKGSVKQHAHRGLARLRDVLTTRPLTLEADGARPLG